MLDNIECLDELRSIPTVAGRKLALIEGDEYDFIPNSLERWMDRKFTAECGYGPIWRNRW